METRGRSTGRHAESVLGILRQTAGRRVRLKMWKRGGQSSALDRAQAPLSGQRSSRGAGEPAEETAARTPDVRPQSSLSGGGGGGGGGGSRFLKKAPPPAAVSSLSPVRKSRLQQVSEHRNVSSSQRGSQTAALSRLAQIESRVRSRRQVQEQSRPAEDLTSDFKISPPPAAPSPEEAAVQPSVRSSSEQSQRGKRFLKKKTTVSSSDPVAPAVGVRSGSESRSRAAEVSGSKVKSMTAVRGVSLESDEEDMRKLLGDSPDSSEKSFLTAGRRLSRRPGDKTSRVDSSPPRCPASPPARHSSPFRFTGQGHAHFSPSVLSPPPASPSPLGGRSPQRSLSSLSGHGEAVLSLEELFPAGPDDPHSELSAASSGDFKINVMTLDDLGFTEETPREEPEQREAEHSSPRPAAPNRNQEREQLKEEKKKEEEEEEQEEEVLDYHSDFESESRTEPDHSASLVSEHLQGEEEEEVREEEEEEVEVREEEKEVREEASDCGRTEEDYSSTFSDSSTCCRSRSSESPDSRTSSRRSRRNRTSTRRVFKEAAVQTQPQSDIYTRFHSLAPAAGLSFVAPSPAVAHTLSAEMVEALSTFSPSAFALHEMLKQQLNMTRRFIENSRRLHRSLLQSLGPPDYRYTTLEDLPQLRRFKLTPEEVLQDQI